MFVGTSERKWCPTMARKAVSLLLASCCFLDLQEALDQPMQFFRNVLMLTLQFSQLVPLQLTHELLHVLHGNRP
jgi:hypothetical protein